MNDLAANLSGRHIQRFLFAGLISLAAFMAWQHYFMQDDAYITFRYAKNMEEGNGLVWYPGLREFGYTNFLFTLMVGVMMCLGIAPEIAAMFISFPAFIGTVILVVLLVRSICNNSWAAWAAGLAVATHYTISSYASGGMETSLQMFLVLQTYYLAFRYCQEPGRISFWHIALSSSLALLCRLDSALLLGYAYLYLFAYFYQQAYHRGRDYFASRTFWVPVLAMTLTPVLVVGILLAGCGLYYGTPLPNTFYAKVDTNNEYFTEGLDYFFEYLNAELFFPVVLLLLTVGASLWAKKRGIVGSAAPFYLLGGCTIWVLYLLYLGGDFMEFRMLVPMLPLFYVACFCVIAEAASFKQRWIWIPLALVCVGVNIEHGRIFQPTSVMDSIYKLNWLVRAMKPNWISTGESLRKLFYTGAPDDVLMALHPVGAIPYFSGLPTVDLYGLNDLWVAQHGSPSRRMAGHRRRAPYSYMVDRKVNIIIDFPHFYCPGPGLHPGGESGVHRQYSWLPTLLIPTDSGCYLVANYLTPNGRINDLIERGIIKEIPVGTPTMHGYFKVSFPPFK